jgi:hypothetical protein
LAVYIDKIKVIVTTLLLLPWIIWARPVAKRWLYSLTSSNLGTSLLKKNYLPYANGRHIRYRATPTTIAAIPPSTQSIAKLWNSMIPPRKMHSDIMSMSAEGEAIVLRY